MTWYDEWDDMPHKGDPNGNDYNYHSRPDPRDAPPKGRELSHLYYRDPFNMIHPKPRPSKTWFSIFKGLFTSKK